MLGLMIRDAVLVKAHVKDAIKRILGRGDVRVKLRHHSLAIPHNYKIKRDLRN